MVHTGKIAPVDKNTFKLELAEYFGPVLDALGKPSNNVPFMMPARIAATPPDEQITEIVGSGPFKFPIDEWQPGAQAVYVRNPDYIPRDEAASGSTGGKKAYLDKVIWRYIPDPWEAAEDLAAGKVDWWEQPPLDFIPKIEQNPDLQTFLTDPLGTQGWLKPNCLHPPFNNRKARQALLHMMDQETNLAWAFGQSQYYQPCEGHIGGSNKDFRLREEVIGQLCDDYRRQGWSRAYCTTICFSWSQVAKKAGSELCHLETTADSP
jgi:peptide/nickel transport system substrate-binding protein